MYHKQHNFTLLNCTTMTVLCALCSHMQFSMMLKILLSLWLQTQNLLLHCKGKGKVHLRTGHKGPEVEQMCSSTLSLASTLDGDECSVPCPSHLTPQGRPSTHCIGGWVGSRDRLDGRGKSRPHRDSIPGPSSP